jgi:hypothetical protein
MVPLLTPKSEQNVPGLSTGAIAGICVGAVVTAVASAALLFFNFHHLNKKALKSILQVQVSQKVHVETSPDMDAEYGPQYSPKADFSSDFTSPMDTSQATVLDVHVVNSAEEMANELLQQSTPSDLQSTISTPFLQRSARYQSLVLEEAD